MDQLFDSENDEQYIGIPLPHKFTVLLQLATGLEYIHSQKVVHRDLKPQNVLISNKKSVIFKWADFGLSKSNVTEHGTFLQTVPPVGTYYYMAPELLEKLDSKSMEKDKGTVKSDVYSEGLVFGYYLLDGTHVLGANWHEIRENSKNGNTINSQSKIS